MTDTEINIAIAKKCGWVDIQQCGCPAERHSGVIPGGGDFTHIPSYTTDLNAMADAESCVIWPNAFHAVHFPELLFEVVIGKKYDGTIGYFLPQYTRATARQRAEAFLRTLHLWKD